MSAPQQPGWRPARGKSRVVAGLLNLFLGGFGIGDFYLGYTQYASTRSSSPRARGAKPSSVDLGHLDHLQPALLLRVGRRSARRSHHDLPGQVDLREGRQRHSPPSELCLCALRALLASRAGAGNAGPRALSTGGCSGDKSGAYRG